MGLIIGRLFLGTFAKLRRKTVNFVMSVRPSTWNNSVANRRIFMKFYLSFFRRSIDKIQVSQHLIKLTCSRVLYLKALVYSDDIYEFFSE